MKIQDLNQYIRENFPPYTNNITSGNIRSITKEYLEKFYKIISNLTDENIDSLKINYILKQLEIQNTNIINAIDHFLAGDIIEYYLSIYNTFFNTNLGIKNIYYKKWPSKVPFYRLRVNQPNKKYRNYEMFHIPFEEVRRTGNQRFSLSGQPSLYLGSSAFICWEELLNPTLESCNFSVFRNESELNLFDLTPPIIRNVEDILRFPLIISSSIKLDNNGYTFKPEYIIPQALYFSIIRFNKIDLSKENAEIKKIDGLVYLSTHISNDLLFDDLNLMHNFVFPVEQVYEKGYCKNLKQLFTVSESKSINDLWLKFPHLFVDIQTFSTYQEEYELSIFKTIEKYICGKTVKKSKIE